MWLVFMTDVYGVDNMHAKITHTKSTNLNGIFTYIAVINIAFNVIRRGKHRLNIAREIRK